MKLEVRVVPLPIPEPVGAHELAWSYLLDWVFADAYHAGVAGLRMTLPSEALVAEAELRAELSGEGGEGWGVALLGGGDEPLAGARRVYTLAFRGVVAPPPGTGRGWVEEAALYVYTWRARAWGGVMLLASLLGWPSIGDWAWHRVRREFAATRPTLAYYRLSIRRPA